MSACGFSLIARRMAWRVLAAADDVTQQVFTTTRSTWREGCPLEEFSVNPDFRSAVATTCVSYWLTLQPIVLVMKDGIVYAIASLNKYREGLISLDETCLMRA